MATYLSDIILGSSVNIDFQAIATKGSINNIVIHPVATAPANPVEGQMYFDSSGGVKTMNYYDGTTWQVFGTGGGSVVSVTGGVGIATSGTGTDPVIDLDITGLTTIGATVVSGDVFSIYDLSVGAHRKVTFGEIEGDITHANIIGAGGNIHVDHSTVSITAGTGLTGGGDITSTKTINVGAGSGISVAADTVNLDIVGLTSQATPLTTDVLPYYNGTANRKLTFANLTTFLSGELDLEFGIAGDTGTGTVATSQTLTVDGTANEIETSASGQTITIGLPANVTISTDLTVGGDLTVNGTTITANVDTFTVEDPLIKMGNNNAADTVDLGIYWAYTATGTKYGGIFRDTSDGDKAITFFEQGVTEPGTTVTDAGNLADVKFGTVRSGTWVGTAIDEAYIDSALPRIYSADIGDGTNTTLQVTHNLGSNDVIVQIYDNTTDDIVYADVDRYDASTNRVDITFNSIPASNAYRVVIIG